MTLKKITWQDGEGVQVGKECDESGVAMILMLFLSGFGNARSGRLGNQLGSMVLQPGPSDLLIVD